ncbi:DUF3558 domain-containing protein [Amycolatopsis anabasis]|uniref:DUF3558 domain-containing protein n=1 Tax=Amycolatopsis anabasis TaxID=1840409 RepID=UPI00131D8CCA|nr:DUF3558 domain-containing protein [Amycolatopsis anabasis]
MIRKTCSWIPVAAVALLVLASCSRENPGKANPSGSASPSENGSASSQVVPGKDDEGRSKAPVVQSPLDGSKFIADPCLSLTQSQLQRFEVSQQGQRSEDQNGVGCRWRFGSEGATSAAVSYLPKVENGLSNLYALNDSGFWRDGYFEPTEVEGYPAVYNSVADQRAQGSCGMAVGINDRLMFSVLISDRPGRDVCKAAGNFATAVVQTIKGGQ